MSNIVFDQSKIPVAFDNDIFALKTAGKIFKNKGCLDFVETGTFMGGTSFVIYKNFPDIQVWTVEADDILYKNAANRFADTNIRSFLGNSIEILKNNIIPNLRLRPFFFLDSHVSAYNVSQNPSLKEYYPLKEEILEIAKIKNLRPIIAIHDFYNPQHPDYVFDKDHGVPLDWNYIKNEIKEVYPDQESIPYFYNDEATGNKNGIIYIGV